MKRDLAMLTESWMSAHVRRLRRQAALGLLALAVAVFPRPVAGAAATSDEQLLEEAVAQYQAALDSTDRDERLQRFRRAELLFSGLAAGSSPVAAEARPAIENADLYVNLGNAALGAGRLGPAIVAYRRALRIDPNHRRARQNLSHARTLLPDWVPRPEEGGLLDTFFSWTGQLSVSEQHWAAALLFAAAALLLAASIRWRRTALRNLAAVPAVAWLLTTGVLVVHAAGDRTQPAVVTTAETVARAADSTNAPARFTEPLPSGTEVDITQTRGDWAHVRLADGRDAWVHQSALQRIRPPVP